MATNQIQSLDKNYMFGRGPLKKNISVKLLSKYLPTFTFPIIKSMETLKLP